ncbi:hypothetical protein GDO81_017916 [Engystomops pustulosus]|uniref:Receptor-type tyrosine-protein phosphatase C n=1 Tax=Engystomops pustulosus TaxID=76066 RepID=A0AAV7A9Z6_ENGPU|nr:hypothetical protein GDO81_017916 [Engystomops pustulosus]KAG8556080.1 hypothetical protein GDO81_017916 [Engystomops pustulosus]
MNLYLKLIVLGFLLWDQNYSTLGQDTPSGGQGTFSPAPQSTSSIQNFSNDSSRITSSTSSQTHSGPFNPQALSTSVPLNLPIPANNSTAVPEALTAPTINTSMSSMSSFIGDSNSSDTQASTHTPTMDLTSPVTDTPRTDLNKTISPEDVSPSTPEDNPIPFNCREIKDIKVDPPLYKELFERLKIHIPKNLTHNTLKCLNISSSGEYTFELLNFNFSVSMCTSITIRCWFEECTERFNFSTNLDVPPRHESYSLKVIEATNQINFKWHNQKEAVCHVVVKSNCSDVTGNITEGGDIVDGLDPYTKYNCNSDLLYGGKTVKRENINVTTLIGHPEEVQDLKCNTTKKNVTLRWKEPNKPNGPLDGYKVQRLKGEWKDVNNTEYTFSGLKPFTEYTFNVTAFNNRSNNLLGKSKEISCKTKEDEPSEVTNVKSYVGPQNNGVTIKCKEPNSLNGPVGEYVLEFDNLAPMIKGSCLFVIKDLSYLTTYKFKIYYKHTEKGKQFEGEVNTKYNDKALIGFLAFFITLTCLALIFVMFKIYKLQKKSSCNLRDNYPLIAHDDEGSLLNIEPIPVDLLLEAYKRKNADEGRFFLDEFQSIPRVFSKLSIKEARKPCNQSKNRYIDILPYDNNRVVLSEIHGEPGSDYINASYINGFKEPRKYIAAQGPKEETMNDFWRMIWEQKSTIIVMVTRCEEGNRNKCAQYWPQCEGELEDYGDVTVKITEEKFFPDYITRKLHINNRREKSERDITHIQFTVWPDHGVPDDPNLLLKLRRRVNALSNFFSGPTIVHCSAGVGRTGTYISIDAMLEGLEAESRVDVYGYVVQLRRQRCLMVQVEAQYIFIHKSLVEYNQFGETEIITSELPHLLHNMKKNDPPSEPSQLTSEFQRLPSYKNWRPQTVGNHQDNKDKNRSSSVVPYEFNRVQVKVDDEPERENTEDDEMSTDQDSESEESIYINASYIIGYWGTRSMIAAQSPLPNTMVEFWQMIFQRKMKAIVMLSGPNQESSDQECAQYWKEKSKTYGDLEVALTDENPCGAYTERTFEIRHTKRKDIRKVSQFHYNQWEDLPKDTNGLLEMIEKIRKNIPCNRMEEHSRHDRSVPLLVHCSDGSQRSGTFCALWNLLESAKVEEVIDVFQTVKHLRRQRSGMLSFYEQYEFLYDTVASTIPAQNGQVQITIHQEHDQDNQQETKNKTPEESQAATASVTEDTAPTPKVDETAPNGPSAAVFTEVSLRIDE